jgi:hypothetical protein
VSSYWQLRPEARFVNVYSVTRRYGGPEEGGWYYDVGEVLASVPVTTDEDEASERRRLLVLFGPDYEDERSRFSVLGGANLEIYIEEHVGRDFPATTPHYE